MAVIKRDTCPVCATPDMLLYNLEPTDPSEGLACAPCVRSRARKITRWTPCDKCGAPWAWRNPKTRRNEYMCGNCHAESGEGVVLNKWFARVSTPHALGRRAKCAVANNDCRGEIKPRGPAAQPLCTHHAGKKSAIWSVETDLIHPNL